MISSQTSLLVMFLLMFSVSVFIAVFYEALSKGFEWERDVPKAALLLIVLGATLLFVPLLSIGGVLTLEGKVLSGSFSHPGALLVVLGCLGLFLSKSK